MKFSDYISGIKESKSRLVVRVEDAIAGILKDLDLSNELKMELLNEIPKFLNQLNTNFQEENKRFNITNANLNDNSTGISVKPLKIRKKGQLGVEISIPGSGDYNGKDLKDDLNNAVEATHYVDRTSLLKLYGVNADTIETDNDGGFGFIAKFQLFVNLSKLY